MLGKYLRDRKDVTACPKSIKTGGMRGEKPVKARKPHGRGLPVSSREGLEHRVKLRA
jgi:hypothetical protein